MTVMYGISNCDTVRKAKKWLTEQDIDFTFHDFRKDGIDPAWLEHVEAQLGWQTLLNKRGTTFRQLDQKQKENIDQTSAIALMLEYPAMIKRPVLQHQDKFYCGFKAASYEQVFV